MSNPVPDSLVDLAPESTHNSFPWYALRVQAKFEKMAAKILRERDFDEFLPLYQVTHKWSDRVKKIDLPLFPGYLFCRLDIEKRLLPVLTAPGVLGIVGAGKHPLPLPDHEIEALQIACRSGLPLLPWPSLAAGQTILIEHGPLTGAEGIVLDVDRKHKLIVSISLLQRAVAVELPREWVRPVSQPARVPDLLPPGYRVRDFSHPASTSGISAGSV